MAWVSLSLACFADPPAESPSTKNNSVSSSALEEQSVSFPGNAGPRTTRFQLLLLL